MRWGLPDFALVWVLATLAGSIAAIPWLNIASDGTVKVTGAALVAGLVATDAGLLAGLVVLARWKGRGSLRGDFGLALRSRDLGWFAAGVGFALASGWALFPIQSLAGGHAQQGVADAFEKSHGVAFVIFACSILAIAPVAEELLFRGLLLRALLRRVPPAWAVLLGATAFALTHAAGDPSVGTFVALPALVALGVLNGVLATRQGDCSRSILVHAGFNAVAVIGILATR